MPTTSFQSWPQNDGVVPPPAAWRGASHPALGALLAALVASASGCTDGMSIAMDDAAIAAPDGALDAGSSMARDGAVDASSDAASRDAASGADALAPDGGCATGTPCNGACVDLQSDPLHCNGCGNACPAPAGASATCTAGVCGLRCGAGQHACDDTCVSDTQPATCGSACTPCTAPAHASATCDGSACGFECDAGFADCDGDASNGCEIDVRTAAHCGACTVTCSGATPVCDATGTTPVCTSGCATTSTLCDTACVDTRTDPSHCGSCEIACAAPANGQPTCEASHCDFTCEAGYHRCGDACVADDDPAHCGAACTPCSAPPGASATCDGTTCGIACPVGEHLCGGACVDNGAALTCGGACSPCPTDPHGVAGCDGAGCSLACDLGYELAGGACADVDECVATPGICGAGSCSNAAGTYACTCAPGYRAPATGGTCSDVDECAEMPLRCGPASAYVCTNTAGGFDCTCAPGHHACGSACALDTDPATCGSSCTPCPVPTGGSATCDGTGCGASCPGGTHLCGDACVDDGSSATCGASCTPCPVDAHGTTGCDGVSCTLTCDAGYVRVGASCVDVDECALTSGLCGVGTCDNVGGSYRCVCPAGYDAPAAGGSCTDVDECAAGSSPCGAGSTGCANTTGSYTCTCAAGYVSAGAGMGGTCTDRDECTATPAICSTGGVGGGNERGCTNIAGSYTCACLPGWNAPPSGGSCATTCGDGARGGTEMCDDGNTASNDGCSSSCRVEYGWTCDTSLRTRCNIAWSLNDGSYNFIAAMPSGSGFWAWNMPTAGGWNGYAGATTTGEWLLTTPLRVAPPRATPYTSAQFRLVHTVNFQNAVDGGVVEVSIDGGAWTQIRPSSGQDLNRFIFDSSTNPLHGSWVFSSVLGSVTSGYVLAIRPGQTFQIRFHGGNDNTTSGQPVNPAWVIDDVAITF